jgi:hypothetical protein
MRILVKSSRLVPGTSFSLLQLLRCQRVQLSSMSPSLLFDGGSIADNTNDLDGRRNGGNGECGGRGAKEKSTSQKRRNYTLTTRILVTNSLEALFW